MDCFVPSKGKIILLELQTLCSYLSSVVTSSICSIALQYAYETISGGLQRFRNFRHMITYSFDASLESDENIGWVMTYGHLIALHRIQWLGCMKHMPSHQSHFRSFLNELGQDWRKQPNGLAMTWSRSMNNVSSASALIGASSNPRFPLVRKYTTYDFEPNLVSEIFTVCPLNKFSCRWRKAFDLYWQMTPLQVT